jgi:hypothetical protein
VFQLWMVSMLNVAFYNIPGHEDSDLMRPIVLQEAGARSIMVTDVNVLEMTAEDFLKLHLDGVPEVICRLDGEVVFELVGMFDIVMYRMLLDYANERQEAR